MERESGKGGGTRDEGLEVRNNWRGMRYGLGTRVEGCRMYVYIG